MGRADFVKQEQLDRLWRNDNGPEASALIDREYASSMDRLDNQFRADNIFLRPYFKLEDSAWSQDFLYPTSGSEPVTLPMLSNGQKALNFRTSGEYRAALRADFVRELKDAGKLPDAYRGIEVGGKTLGELFPTGRLTDTQILGAANMLRDHFMQPFYDKLNPVLTYWLQENPKYLEPLLRWDYKPGSVALAPYLP